MDDCSYCHGVRLVGCELEETTENREWGLSCDKAHIERCDEVWLVGPRVSPGMALERQHAVSCGIPTYDLTGLAFGDKETEHWVRLALAEQGWRP